MATVDEANAALEKAKADLAAAEADAVLAKEAATRPRPVGSVLIDIVRHLVSRAGNHPDLEKLEKELNAALGEPDKPATYERPEPETEDHTRLNPLGAKLTGDKA